MMNEIMVYNESLREGTKQEHGVLSRRISVRLSEQRGRWYIRDESCTEAVQCAAGALESVDDVEGRHGFAVKEYQTKSWKKGMPRTAWRARCR
jgi:hypothetical protein